MTTLHREKDNRLQKELMKMQNRMLEEQTAIKNSVNELVKQGKITKETAQEILTTVISNQVQVEEEVIIKLSPEKKNRKN